MSHYDIALVLLFNQLLNVSSEVDTLRSNMVTKEDLKVTKEDLKEVVKSANNEVRVDLLKAINQQTLLLVAFVMAVVAALVVVPRLWP